MNNVAVDGGGFACLSNFLFQLVLLLQVLNLLPPLLYPQVLLVFYQQINKQLELAFLVKHFQPFFMGFRLKRRTIIHIRLTAKTPPFFQLMTLVRNKSLRRDFPFKKRPFFLINELLSGVGTGLEQVYYFLVPLVFQQFQVAFQLFLHFVLHLHDSLP